MTTCFQEQTKSYLVEKHGPRKIHPVVYMKVLFFQLFYKFKNFQNKKGNNNIYEGAFLQAFLQI